MDTNVGPVTVSVVVPVIAPDVAVTVEDPTAAPVARPAPLIVAAALDELQPTEFVMSFVELSEYVPVAVNCCVRPLAIDGFTGVTAIETRFAGVTVSVVVPLIEPKAAVIVEEPAPTPVASPVLLIVAAAIFDELHTTEFVMSFVELSEYVPVALNCTVAPLVMDGLTGVTAMESREAWIPVPVSGTLCGLALALSATWTEPFREPSAVGVHVTETVQNAPTATVVVQLLVCAKWQGAVFLVMFKVALPLFVIVNVRAGLVAPTGWLPKGRLVGLNAMPGTPAPVPDNETVCGVLVALSLIVSVPVLVPKAVGVKVTEIEQKPPPEIAVPVQFWVSAKSPEIVTEFTVNGRFPEFVTVTICAALVVLRVCEANTRLAPLKVTAGAPTPEPVTW